MPTLFLWFTPSQKLTQWNTSAGVLYLIDTKNQFLLGCKQVKKKSRICWIKSSFMFQGFWYCGFVKIVNLVLKRMKSGTFITDTVGINLKVIAILDFLRINRDSHCSISIFKMRMTKYTFNPLLMIFPWYITPSYHDYYIYSDFEFVSTPDVIF